MSPEQRKRLVAQMAEQAEQTMAEIIDGDHFLSEDLEEIIDEVGHDDELYADAVRILAKQFKII